MSTPDDRTTIHRMIVYSGYEPSTAAYEMATRGRDRAEMDALAAEVAVEVYGMPRPAPLPSLRSALSRRAALFGPVEVDA